MNPKKKTIIILLAAPIVASLPLAALVTWSSLQHFCKMSETGRCFPLGTMFARIYDKFVINHYQLSDMYYMVLITCFMLVTAVFAIKWLTHYFEKKSWPEVERAEYVYLFLISAVLSHIFLVPMLINLFFWPSVPGMVTEIDQRFEPFAAAMEEYRDAHGRYPLAQYQGRRRRISCAFRPTISYPPTSLPFEAPFTCGNQNWIDKSWGYQEYMNGGGYCLEISLPKTAPLSHGPNSSSYYTLVKCEGIAIYDAGKNSRVMEKYGPWSVVRSCCD